MKKINNYKFSEFHKIKEQIEQSFPQKMKVGFYLKNFKTSSVSSNPKLNKVIAGSVVEIRGDLANLRIYRTADSGNHLYDVDEKEGVNKSSLKVKKPQEIRDHHLNKNIPDDMMSANNLMLEVIENADGTLSLNANEHGMVNAFVNFPDPRDSFIKKIISPKKSK